MFRLLRRVFSWARNIYQLDFTQSILKKVLWFAIEEIIKSFRPNNDGQDNNKGTNSKPKPS
ncbi:hypothetical protein [Neobacillus mesonae]|uniref:hypothetical protein n=1 Tax=Neobacillus mesonae TaxID=1193713 RepID=UPI002574064C|nr:hypothetical protein [Neobacillus mesonae]